MPEYLAPGVYVEEVSARSHPIEGVSTGTAGFIGVAQRGTAAIAITSFAELQGLGDPTPSEYLSIAVRGFFENGGRLCYVARTAATDSIEAGLDALANEKVSIVCCPDQHHFSNAAAAMVAHCEERKDRVCLLQSPHPVISGTSHHAPVHSSYVAYYHPWLTVTGLDGLTAVTVPPSGHLAGVYARTDSAKGVWAAPAGVPITAVKALSQDISTPESDLLVARGINVLRNFPGQGISVWSARTTSEDSEWKYINLRRYAIYIEESLRRGLQWAIFEPNGLALWENVRATVETFLYNLWEAGALMGQKPKESFFVRCGPVTMSQADIDLGRVVVVVGYAPVRPMEYVILRVTCQTEGSAVSASIATR